MESWGIFGQFPWQNQPTSSSPPRHSGQRHQAAWPALHGRSWESNPHTSTSTSLSHNTLLPGTRSSSDHAHLLQAEPVPAARQDLTAPSTIGAPEWAKTQHLIKALLLSTFPTATPASPFTLLREELLQHFRKPSSPALQQQISSPGLGEVSRPALLSISRDNAQKRKKRSKAEGLFSSCIPPAFHINYSSVLPGLCLPKALHHKSGCAVVGSTKAKPREPKWPLPRYPGSCSLSLGLKLKKGGPKPSPTTCASSCLILSPRLSRVPGSHRAHRTASAGCPGAQPCHCAGGLRAQSEAGFGPHPGEIHLPSPSTSRA